MIDLKQKEDKMTEPEFTANHIPPLEEVSAAYSDILAYNSKRAGLGAAMANIMLATIESSEQDILDEEDAAQPTSIDANDPHTKSAPWAEGVKKQLTEGEMEADLQDVFHSDIFERIGIKVSPLGARAENDQGFAASNRELKPIVDNTELYVDFLKQLNKDTLQENPDNYRLMGDVLGMLSSAVQSGFGRAPEGLSEDDMAVLRRYGEDALRTFTAIEPEYERLGLDRPEIYVRVAEAEQPKVLNDEWRLQYDARRYLATYAELRDDVEYWSRNVLPEYLEVGNDLRIDEQTWYFDGGHDKLVSRVDYIVSLQLDERTKAFGREVASAKAQSLELTLKEMDDEPREWFASPANRKLVEDQLARLRAVTEAA